MTHRTTRTGRVRTVASAVTVAVALVLVIAGCRFRPTGGYYEREARTVQRGTPDERPYFCNAVGDGTPPSGHGNGAHVHPYYQGKTKGPLSWADCTKLAKQLDQTLNALKGFETRAKAEAAGWRAVAPYVPGLGTHHTRFGGGGMTPGGSIPFDNAEIQRITECIREKGVDVSGGAPNFGDPAFIEALRACGVPIPAGGIPGGMGGMTPAGFGAFDPAKPPMLIFGGNDPDAPLVGVAYAFMGGDTPPEAYAGGNDWWHLHTHACFGLDLERFPDPEDLTEEQCRAAGGFYQRLFPGPDGTTGGVWLLHMWLPAPYEYRPDMFVSGHPCLGRERVLPQDDPCWENAHRDPADVPPPTTVPGGHGDHGHGT